MGDREIGREREGERGTALRIVAYEGQFQILPLTLDTHCRRASKW